MGTARPVRLRAGVMVALILCVALPGMAEEVRGTFSRTLKVSGALELDVDNGAGKITVRSGPAGTVRVEGEIKTLNVWNRSAAEERVRKIERDPPVDQRGNLLRVGRSLAGDLRKGVSISYVIVVPPDTRLRAETGLGDIVAEGLRANVHVTTGAGSVWLADLHGEIWARTGLGSIEIRGARGAINAKTGSGNLHVEGAPTATWRLETGLGNVSVQLPEKGGFEIWAHTGLGSIHSAHRLDVKDDIASSDLRGKVRGGGPLVHISTGAGSINIS